MRRSAGQALAAIGDGVRVRSGAGVGAVVGLEQMRAVDLGIALRGREAGVAEQLLDGAQIGAGAEEMRGEGMAQRMRRRRLGQAERGARARDPELDDARARAACPARRRTSGSSEPSLSGQSAR